MYKDHPRTRGEKLQQIAANANAVGSPPHARGKEELRLMIEPTPGITPARAGKRTPGMTSSSSSRDHPRTRGEKRLPSCVRTGTPGSPPHARGKGVFHLGQRDGGRITPARAGKSNQAEFGESQGGDHPRTRGEKKTSHAKHLLSEGSPPHARGKVPVQGAVPLGEGITPARAGKSRPRTPRSRPWWDHPRTRGEKEFLKLFDGQVVGSPPHARGKGRFPQCGSIARRITPARAGKRIYNCRCTMVAEDHPRTRGEKRIPPG